MTIRMLPKHHVRNVGLLYDTHDTSLSCYGQRIQSTVNEYMGD